MSHKDTLYVIKSPDIGAIDFCLVKSIAALLRPFILGQSYLIGALLEQVPWLTVEIERFLSVLPGTRKIFKSHVVAPWVEIPKKAFALLVLT